MLAGGVGSWGLLQGPLAREGLRILLREYYAKFACLPNNNG